MTIDRFHKKRKVRKCKKQPTKYECKYHALETRSPLIRGSVTGDWSELRGRVTAGCARALISTSFATCPRIWTLMHIDLLGFDSTVDGYSPESGTHEKRCLYSPTF